MRNIEYGIACARPAPVFDMVFQSFKLVAEVRPHPTSKPSESFEKVRNSLKTAKSPERA